MSRIRCLWFTIGWNRTTERHLDSGEHDTDVENFWQNASLTTSYAYSENLVKTETGQILLVCFKTLAMEEVQQTAKKAYHTGNSIFD